jgi:hypothetical protein
MRNLLPKLLPNMLVQTKTGRDGPTIFCLLYATAYWLV